MTTRLPVMGNKHSAASDYRVDLLILSLLVLGALTIRFGFLAEYPNFLLHEDSGPYLFEAERLLEGRETHDGLPGRAPGYPLFLAGVLRLISTDLLHIIMLQHILSVAGGLLLALSLRMMGVRRLFAYGFFVAVAFSHRLIHYDNTIGAEMLTVFLMSTAFFLACGMLLRRWSPWAVSAAIGVLSAYLMLVRSASFILPLLIAIWIAVPATHRLNLNAGRRLLLMAFIVLPPLMTAYTLLEWNKHYYGRALLSREVDPTMAFAIAYSGDFTGGKFLEIKHELRPFIETGRAKVGPMGYPGGTSAVGGYQWVFDIFNVISIERLGSQQEKDRVLSGLFWETLLTPHTLFSHLTGHTWRELRFMLFDMTPVANSVVPPREYAHFVRRDTEPLHIVRTRNNIAPGTLLADTLPGPAGDLLQHFTSRYIHVNYHTEYKQKPGVIRTYSVISLVLLGFLTIGVVTSGLRRSIATTLSEKQRGIFSHGDSMALLASLIWIGNALVPCVLVYALHRYSYYSMPFLAFTAFYGIDRLTGIGTAWWKQRTAATHGIRKTRVPYWGPIYWGLIVPVLVLFLLESSLYTLIRGKIIQSLPGETLISSIREIRNAYLDQYAVPIHVPHPYFGNLYNPKKTLKQYAFSMTFDSNSDGFIDDEFPVDRREGECIYGLIGGSAALSLGVKNKEDRISSQLQSLLNTHSKNQHCKHYRVLNMGVGGGLQIQASFIYSYYWRLLDGVIFYVGNNECSIGSRLGSNTPIQFPITDYLSVAESVIKSDSAIKLHSYVLASFDNALTRFALTNPAIFESNILRVIYTIRLNNFENLKKELDEKARKNAPDFARFSRKHEDPNFDGDKFLYKDIALQKKVMNVVLPLIYTDPMIQANAVAKASRSPLLLVIQPMLGATDKTLTAKEMTISPFPLYQKTCVETLKEEGEKLRAHGIVTHDLNRIDLFGRTAERVFIDQSHVNELGNKMVASHLHQLIVRYWHGSSKSVNEGTGNLKDHRNYE